MTAFPHGRTGACPTRRFTRVRARRARPPPFAPHGAASPALALRRGFSLELGGISREMPFERSPDSRCSRMMLQGDPAFLRRIYRVRVGRDPAATPVHSTDVCCSRIQFSEMIPQASTHAISHPTRYGSPRFHAALPTSASRPTCWSVFFSRRRPVGVPLMPRRPAGFPGGACVHQRRPAIAFATSGRTRRPRPSSPSRVNGLWLR